MTQEANKIEQMLKYRKASFPKSVSTTFVAHCSLHFAFQSGCLSISQRRRVICVVPQKNKDKSILGNLRLIWLLNVDYKILAKVIAKRTEKTLPKIINPDQTGYVKCRYIHVGENIRLIQDVRFLTKCLNMQGIAIFFFLKSFLHNKMELSIMHA